MTGERARELFAAARVARLATVRPGGAPHLVPVVFALFSSDGTDTVVTAVDHKPKRDTALRRLANVAHDPRVSLIVDHYDDEDWDALWWVRADGVGRVLAPDGTEGSQAIDHLVARYPQYRDRRPAGPVLAVSVTHWTWWTATPTGQPAPDHR